MLEARVGRLESSLQRLAEALEQLAVRMDQLAAHVDRLALRVDRIDQRLAWLSGDALERRYRERAHSYFQGILTRIQVVPADAERAARRAALLERAMEVPVIPAVAGEQILPDAEAEAKAARVWCVLDGRAEPPPA
ncbi:MAG: hypothetical protein QN175_01225 [Armatimonadota bacterium]|nr:hypothetical protein [Armatimonadota bacterium]MDR7463722.1 hypothetical protein [Armatimonadota bacterium]MDR7470185.1 hypothetical protein [Armatimonadota bacterium]MDR7473613.1 hypothetical protein [Armatimonadota bacterium]